MQKCCAERLAHSAFFGYNGAEVQGTEVWRVKILFRSEPIGAAERTRMPTEKALGAQTVQAAAGALSVWEQLGIELCLLKQIPFESDRAEVTRKRHYHTGAEIHMIERGSQTYELEGARVTVSAGQFLWIMPRVKHVALQETPHTGKYAFYLQAIENSAFALAQKGAPPFLVGELPPVVRECIGLIASERERRTAFGKMLIRNRVAECVIHFLRMPELNFDEAPCDTDEGEDERFVLARQYIEDNIHRAISVPELAGYCHIGEKQLTRIFRQETGGTVAAYMRRERCRQIEKMLAETTLSLCEISEALGFGNEYHFHAFYKKYAGMTPGAYRRAMQKK